MNELPHDVEQVLIGSLLGDGGVYPPERGNAYFSEAHSHKQSDYLKWKAQILGQIFGGKVAITKKGQTSYRSKAHPVLTGLRQLWYPDGKKIVRESELQKLDALGLAVWYQDDGTYDYQKHRCSLAIAGFNGQEFVIKQFFKKCGLSSYICHSSGYPSLYFSGNECGKFLNMIVEHVHPSLIYKLGHLHPDNRSKLEGGHEKKREREKRYYQKNREIFLKRQRKYYLEHRDVVRQQQREYWHRQGKFLRALRRQKQKEGFNGSRRGES